MERPLGRILVMDLAMAVEVVIFDVFNEDPQILVGFW